MNAADNSRADALKESLAEWLLKDDIARHERQAVIDMFLRISREATSSESCALFLRHFDRPGQIVMEATLTDKFGHNFHRGVVLEVHTKARGGISGYLATLRVPFRMHGAQLVALPWYGGFKPEHLKSCVCWSVLTAPLIDKRGHFLGYIKCENKKSAEGEVLQDGGYDQSDEGYLCGLAKELVVALERLDDFEAFRRSGMVEAQGPDLQEFLRSLLAEAKALVGTDRGIAYIVDRGPDILLDAATLGCEELDIKANECNYSLNEKAIATRVFNSGMPYLAEDTSMDQTANPWGVARYQVKGSMLGVPLTCGKDVLGCLLVWSSKGEGPSREDLPPLLSLGRIGGTALAKMLRDRNVLLSQFNLLRDLDAGLIQKDSQFRFVYCNRFVLELLGKRFEDVHLKTDFELYGVDLGGKYRRDDEYVIDTGRSFVDVEMNRDEHGDLICVTVLKQLLKDRHGQVNGIQCFFVRLRGGWYEKLEEAEKIAQLGSWDWDLDTKKLSGSKQLWSLFELEPGGGPAVQTFLKRVHQDDYEQVEYLLKDIEGNPRDFEFEFRIVRINRSQRWLKARGKVLRDATMVPVRMYGTFQDITEARIQEATKIQNAKLLAIGEVADRTAHSTLGHFQVISFALQRLEGRVQEPSLQRSIVRAYHSYNDAHAALTELKRLGSHGNEPFERDDINVVIKSVIEDLEPDFCGFGITISTYLADNLPRVLVHKRKVKEVIMAILKNAKEAMPKGGNITVATREDRARQANQSAVLPPKRLKVWDSDVIVEIGDTGIGIEPEKLEKIFEPHFTNKADQGGTGLGLPHCRDVMDLHGGHVYATSKPSAGATFFLVFPSVRSDL